MAHEIVEITATQFKPNESVDVGLFDSFPVTDAGEPIYSEDGLFITSAVKWRGFSFRCVGESFDPCYSGGIAYNIEQVSAGDTFEYWIPELAAIADRLLVARRKEKLDDRINTVRFLTLWTYTAHRDYEGEWDEDWDMLGVIDADKLKLALMESMANVAP